MKIRFTGESGQRLDHFLQEQLSAYSRSRIQSWIREDRVLVDGAPAKSSLLLRGRETIDVSPADLPPLKAAAEKLGKVDFTNLWAGQAVRLGREMPAAELTRALAGAALARLSRMAG